MYICLHIYILKFYNYYSQAVISLISLPGCCFGYALANGVIGVYKGQERLWRIKVSYCTCYVIADVF